MNLNIYMIRRFVSGFVRSLFAFLPYIGFINKPNSRPNGISAIVRVHNEIEWITASINSIKNHVDEIIAVDTGSTDGTWESLKTMKSQITNLKIYKFPSYTHWEFSNYGLKKTKYKWILKWDGDFVSANDSLIGLKTLKLEIEKLNPNIYYHIRPQLIEVAGDFYHQFPSLRIRQDIEIFTYSDHSFYVPVERFVNYSRFPIKFPESYQALPAHFKFEGLKTPLFYKTIKINKPIGFHINVRSARECLKRYFHLHWLAENKMKIFPNLESYTLHYIKNIWGFKDLVSAEKYFINALARSVEPYDKSLGELPESIKLIGKTCTYKIVYKENKIVGRNDGF